MWISRRFVAPTVLMLCLAGCLDNVGPQPPDHGFDDLPNLALEVVHTGLTNPTDLQAPNDGTGRIFIAQQAGLIRISQSGTLQDADEAFLDIRDRVVTESLEQGLLGFAFHPDFATNGRFFVTYTKTGDEDAKGNTILAEFGLSADPDRADAGSEQIMLEIEQPSDNHQAGQLHFGPDGMLYVAVGDGGGSCDPDDHAQNLSSLLGKILRLDVDAGPPFVPADNPLVDEPNARPEVYAYGLRNPWRFTIDESSGQLYIADVGQFSREEIDVIPLDPSVAPNFGWRTFEGTNRPPLLCSSSGFVVENAIDPLVEYDHDEGCSITGGYVYRGAAIPELDGAYFYSDFCSAFLRVIRVVDGAVVASADLTDVIANDSDRRLGAVTSFGLDKEGELYILDSDGDVFRLVTDR